MGEITCVSGSMADVPKDLLDQINRLEELFVVDTAKLKEVTNQFVSELERGLREENSTIVSPPLGTFEKSPPRGPRC